MNMHRAGRYLSIIAILQCCNETIPDFSGTVLSQYHTVSLLINMCNSSFEASRLLYQNKSCDSYYWRQEPGTCKSKIIARLRHSNRTVNQLLRFNYA